MIRSHSLLVALSICLFLVHPAFSDGPGNDATNGINGAAANIASTAKPAANGIEPAPAGPMIGGVPVEEKPGGIRWGGVITQSALFFTIEQAFRIGTQPETREALKGPYFKDYITSLRGLGGWNDDDPPLTNYVAHPMQGSIAQWILINNDPKGAPQVFGFKNKAYWVSRFKGLGYSAAYSSFYELSPVGDAAIGNLGINRDYKGAVDLVVTPTVGLGWHLTEDMLDKYFIRWVERKSGSYFINIIVRCGLNPTRTFTNILRFKTPWRRDSRGNLSANKAMHLAKEANR